MTAVPSNAFQQAGPDRSRDGRVVFVFGFFNVLHPGHLRLIYYAADQGDRLVVGLLPKSKPSSMLPDNDRRIALQSISCVDEVVVLDHGLKSYLDELKPEIVVMGAEQRGKHRDIESVIELNGGRVVFSSGAVAGLPQSDLDVFPVVKPRLPKPEAFLRRHAISHDALTSYIDRFPGLNIWVVGDTIIDEYAVCDAVGMSREDPTIVVRPRQSDLYLGGAGVVASHARSLGAKVTFATVTGNDMLAAYAEEKLAGLGINSHVIRDEFRQTTHKKRYRTEGKTMLRVNNFSEQAIGDEAQARIFAEFERHADEIDAVIFSDFNYGNLPQSLVDDIIAVADANSVLVAADSQTSSQLGDISRFTGARLLTPTEHEARVALKNSEDGLVAIAEELRQKTQSRHILITLGTEGLLIHTSDLAEGSEGTWDNDKLPALNPSPKDPAGAGDAMLVMSTLALASGAGIWEAAYLGSVASACQVGRVGNIPLKPEEILHELAMEEGF